jgi:hypothetical protein
MMMCDHDVSAALLRYHPLSPFRPLDWRWGLGTRLAETGARTRRRWIDGWVRRASRHLRRLAPDGRPTSKRRRAADPAVASAAALRTGGDPALLLEVDARLLAGQSYDEAAARCGLGAAAVEAYERLFFAVTDCLESRDYLLFAAMPGLNGRPDGPDTASLLKALAYFRGPYVLDVALHALGVRPAPPGREPTAEAVRACRLLADVRRLAAAEGGGAALLKILAVMDEVEAREAGRSAAPVSGPVIAPLDTFPAPAPVAPAAVVADVGESGDDDRSVATPAAPAALAA